MNIFQSLSLRALFALAMLCGAGAASAAPVYQVTIDTAALAGRSGYLDFLLLGLNNAAPAQATIDGLTGDFAAGGFATGDAAGSVAGGIAIGNGSPWNEFGQWASFGGTFTFRVGFAIEGEASAGSTLSVALLDADFNYLGTPGDVVTFALQPGADVAVFAQAGVATVSAVPEPSTMLQLAAGLFLLAGMARRRARR